MISWSNSFKYLGSFVSSYKLFSYLVDYIVGNANNANGAVRSVCRSAVALPVSRAVGLHKSQCNAFSICSLKLHCVAFFS